MVREDIVAGLRNAVERGYTLQKAKQTLINSGYNPQEVEEAVSHLTGGVGAESFHEPQQTSPNLIQPSQIQHPQQLHQYNPEQMQPLEQVHQLQQSLQQPQHKRSPLLLFLLILLLLLLLGTLVLSLIFKDTIIEFFNGMFS